MFPDFIPASVPGAGPDFVWEGTLDHIGQLEGETELMTKFYEITSCGCFCLAAGLSLWGGARFSQLTDVGSILHLSEAALAFMCCPGSVRFDPILDERVPEAPRLLSAFRKMRWLGMACVLPGRWAENRAPPTRDLYHLAFLVRHLLDEGSRPALDAWIDATTARLRVVAPRPAEGLTALPDDPDDDDVRRYVAPYWGLPVPLAALGREVGADELAPLYAAEVRSIDWSRNPFVARPPKVGRCYGEVAP